MLEGEFSRVLGDVQRLERLYDVPDECRPRGKSPGRCLGGARCGALRAAGSAAEFLRTAPEAAFSRPRRFLQNTAAAETPRAVFRERRNMPGGFRLGGGDAWRALARGAGGAAGGTFPRARLKVPPVPLPLFLPLRCRREGAPARRARRARVRQPDALLFEQVIGDRKTT